jgi:hypothetical protein
MRCYFCHECYFSRLELIDNVREIWSLEIPLSSQERSRDIVRPTSDLSTGNFVSGWNIGWSKRSLKPTGKL